MSGYIYQLGILEAVVVIVQKERLLGAGNTYNHFTPPHNELWLGS